MKYNLSPNELRLLEPYGIKRLRTTFQQLSRKGWDREKCIGKLRIPCIEECYNLSPELGKQAKEKSRMLTRGLMRVYEDSYAPQTQFKDWYKEPPRTNRILNRARTKLSGKARKVCSILNHTALQINTDVADWVVKNELLDYWQEIALYQAQDTPYYLEHVPAYMDRIFALGRLSYQNEKAIRCCVQFAKPYEVPDLSHFLKAAWAQHELSPDNCHNVWVNRDEYKHDPMKVSCAHAMVDVLKTGKSKYIFYMDATGSCLQITGAIMRDPHMAENSNLLPVGDRSRKDPYGFIARPDTKKYQNWKKTLVTPRMVRKKIIKPVSMPHGYGSGDFTAARNMFGYRGSKDWESMWKEYCRDTTAVNFKYPEQMIIPFLASDDIPDATWRHVVDVATTVREWNADEYPIQELFIDCLRDAAESYYDRTQTAFSFQIGDLQISSLGIKSGKTVSQVSSKRGLNKSVNLFDIEFNSGSSAAMAILIHALDALTLCLAIIRLHNKSIQVVAIHDSMGLPINEALVIGPQEYTTAMCDALGKCSLNTFLVQLGAEPIQLGELDLNDCRTARTLWPD